MQKTPQLTQVARGVFAYIQPDGGWMLNNTGLIAGLDGSYVMVDTTSTERRNRALLAAVHDRIGAHDPRALINTHHHGDHTFGNWLLPTTTPIVGHVHCREDVLEAGLMAAMALPGPDYGKIEIRPPDITFVDRLGMYIGDREVQLIHVGPAHTRNDVIVWLPDERVVFSGDLVFNGGQPFLLEGSVAGYRPALEAIRALQPQIVVPGHGPVCRGDDVPAVLDRLDGYAAWLDHLADEGYEAGRTPLEVAQGADLGEYASWMEGERLAGNLHRAYSERAGDPIGVKLAMPAVFADMATLNGGPIRSHA